MRNILSLGKTKYFALFACLLGTVLQLQAQGYIVPNGVVTNLYPGEIDVWNSGSQDTGFIFTPIGKQAPTVYSNVFSFTEPLTIGVRVFLVASNTPISLQPIISQSWMEFGSAPSYVLANGAPFYVALYTGFNFAPPYPPAPPYFYTDPVFGWAKLVNNQGVIQVLDYAVAYQSAGIYAGTQTIIPVPEPGALALAAVGTLLLGLRRRQPSGR